MRDVTYTQPNRREGYIIYLDCHKGDANHQGPADIIWGPAAAHACDIRIKSSIGRKTYVFVQEHRDTIRGSQALIGHQITEAKLRFYYDRASACACGGTEHATRRVNNAYA